MNEQVIAIIPARGGSKGIPRKNVQVFAGRPLLAHTILHALNAPSVGRVFVSTDDVEIGDVARSWGAEVVQRPAGISGDKASSEQALSHVLEHLEQSEGYRPDLVVFLQATSPLRGETDVEAAISVLRREQADSLFSARGVHGFAWRRGSDVLTPVNYDPVRRPMRQDLTEEILEENGSIYVFRPWVLRELGSRLGGKTAVYIQDALDSFQVDEPHDLDILNYIFEIRRERSAGLPAIGTLDGIQLLVLDFDGVMTDNRVMVSQDGAESVLCNRGDGWGIARLRDAGVEVFVLSTEPNAVVEARCRKLKIGCLHGVEDKRAALEALARDRRIGREAIAYVGNDVNDAGCLAWAGVPIVVADAVPEVRTLAKHVTRNRGGAGAVREVADWILAARR